MIDTPALAHLMGAYFYQDWALEFRDDEWAAVRAFVAGSPSLAPNLPAEIDQLLAQVHTEEALKAHVERLGCDFTSQDEHGGYRGWLTEVARRVREATT